MLAGKMVGIRIDKGNGTHFSSLRSFFLFSSNNLYFVFLFFPYNFWNELKKKKKNSDCGKLFHYTTKNQSVTA